MEEEGSDQTRDPTDALSLLGLTSPMLSTPATATAGNSLNGDNDCRRQRNIYTAFEKARATHVCFFFPFFWAWGWKLDVLQSSYQGSCVYGSSTQS